MTRYSGFSRGSLVYRARIPRARRMILQRDEDPASWRASAAPSRGSRRTRSPMAASRSPAARVPSLRRPVPPGRSRTCDPSPAMMQANPRITAMKATMSPGSRRPPPEDQGTDAGDEGDEEGRGAVLDHLAALTRRITPGRGREPRRGEHDRRDSRGKRRKSPPVRRARLPRARRRGRDCPGPSTWNMTATGISPRSRGSAEGCRAPGAGPAGPCLRSFRGCWRSWSSWMISRWKERRMSLITPNMKISKPTMIRRTVRMSWGCG